MGLSHVGISGRLLVEKMKCSKKLKLYIGYIGLLLLLCPALGGGALSDTAIRPSVRPSVCLPVLHGPTGRVATRPGNQSCADCESVRART